MGGAQESGLAAVPVCGAASVRAGIGLLARHVGDGRMRPSETAHAISKALATKIKRARAPFRSRLNDKAGGKKKYHANRVARLTLRIAGPKPAIIAVRVIGIKKISKAASVCVGKITSWAIHPHPIKARLTEYRPSLSLPRMKFLSVA